MVPETRMVPGIVEIKIRNGRLTVQDQGQYAKFSSFFFLFFSISFEIWMNGSSLEEGRWDWMEVWISLEEGVGGHNNGGALY